MIRLALFVTLSAQAQSGRIQVSALDPAMAPIPAQIRVLDVASGETVGSGQASADRGSYLSPPLPSGRYQIKIRMGGFRTQVLNGILVEPGRTTQVPDVKMKFQGCGSPGVLCDSFGLDSSQNPSDTWQESLRVGCAIDLDRKSKKKCASKSTADLRVEVQNGKMYFVAAGRAQFSPVNPESQNCRTGPYTESRLRVDDLGSGFDMCLKTKRGRILTIFFTSEVPSGESRIPVQFVALR